MLVNKCKKKNKYGNEQNVWWRRATLCRNETKRWVAAGARC